MMEMAAGAATSAMDITGDVLASNARTDNQINDYRNWAYKNTAMLIQQGQDKTTLQNDQAQQTGGAQVGFSGSGTSLSSSNAVGGLGNLAVAQGMEQTNMNVNQTLEQRQSQQALRDQTNQYSQQRTASEVGGFSNAVSAAASALGQGKLSGQLMDMFKQASAAKGGGSGPASGITSSLKLGK